MIEQISFDNGVYNIEEDTENFDIEFDIMSIEAKFRMLSRGYIDKYAMKNYKQNEHIIYILIRGNKPVYVSQSTDSISRINQHKYKNKCNFDRCFIFFKPRKDLRAYLDYMEKYLIYKLESQGLILENSVKLDPEKDILNESKKILSQKWMNTLINFLPIFGVSHLPHLTNELSICPEDKNLPTNISKKTNIKILLNNEQIEGKSNKEIIGGLISKIGIDKIMQFDEQINTSVALLIKDTNFENIIAERSIPVIKGKDELGKDFYFSLSISTNGLIKKVEKIIKTLEIKDCYVLKTK